MFRFLLHIILFLLLFNQIMMAQSGVVSDKKEEKTEDEKIDKDETEKKKESASLIFGTASYYSNKFHGRRTASGEIFNQQKMTAACNVLPLGTWIQVTNLRNNRRIIVKVNDRLHGRMTRAIDLSREAARQLGFIQAGLAKVRVEVLGKKKPSQ